MSVVKCIQLVIAFFDLICVKLSQYEDDFEHEREDRIRVVQELMNIKEELKSYKRPIGAQSAPENKVRL